MLLTIHPDNPNPREMQKVLQILQHDGVIICPTDSVYALVCAFDSKKAYEKILRIKGMKEKDAHFSLFFSSLAQVAEFAKVDNVTYQALRNNLPGPFTFILKPSGKIPEKILGRRKAIGVRIPANNVVMQLLDMIGIPLLTTSLKNSDSDIVVYETDPEVLHDRYENQVDIVLDGGFGDNVPTAVLDATVQPFELLREGRLPLI